MRPIGQKMRGATPPGGPPLSKVPRSLRLEVTYNGTLPDSGQVLILDQNLVRSTICAFGH